MRDESKTKTILASALIILAIVTLLTISLTYARYSEEITSSDDRHTGDTEYIVAHQLEVRSVEEFIAAVENGYSNIKISDEVEDPLVITSGVTDVGADLILDLNGHEIQRNNREPMLNVTEGVRMTIIDSSSSQSGSFYNPVGSVLEISGGTLTVTAGVFESGPRKSEYNSASSDDKIGGSVSASLVTGTYYAKSDTGYTLDETRSMPVITPTVTAMGVDEENKTVWRTNGNIYFDSSVNGYFAADSYIYYTLSDGSTTGLTLGATNNSADFYYTYDVVRNEDGTLGDPTGNENENVLTVTIYGYNNVKGRAEPDTGETPNYSAIGMHDGNMYVRGGSYHSWFGSSSAYGLFAEGGYMAVEQGTFEAIENGVCIKCAYAADVDTSAEYLRIARGNFSSEVGDTISVEGGRMIVTGGTFEKDARSGTGKAPGENGSIISMESGTLETGGNSHISFSLYGSYVYGISSTSSENSSVTVYNANFEFNSDNNDVNTYTDNYGIFSEAGQVSVYGCVFILPDKNSRGISISSGSVSVGGSDPDTPMSGTEYSELLDTNSYSYFYLSEAVGCYGVYAAASGRSGSAESMSVNMSAAQIFIGQKSTDKGASSYYAVNGAGVYMDAGSLSANNAKVELGNVLIITAGNSVSGVYAKSGIITQESSKKLVVVTGANCTDYENGQTKFQNIESYNINTDLVDAGRVSVAGTAYGYGVYSGGGSVTLGSVYAAVYGHYSSGLLVNAIGADMTSDAGVTVNGSIALIVDGGALSNEDGTTNYASASGISTESGTISLNGNADMIVDNGLGITSRNGSVYLYGSNVNITTTHSSAIYVDNGSLIIGTEGSASETNIVSKIEDNYKWVSPPSTTSTDESSLTHQYDGVYVRGGSLTANGTFNVTHKGLANVEYENVYLVNSSDSSSSVYTIKSFAVRVESTTNSNNEDVVTIKSGTITNSVGGGVSVSGGTLNLGESDKDNRTLIVNTTGTMVSDDMKTNGKVGSNNAFNGNWQFKANLTGGSAVEVTGGNLNVYYGTFTAAQGDGIFVKGGNAVINGGSFSGNDEYADGDDNNDIDLRAGIAASYAFKMYGGTVTINGGSFESQGSGAMIIGTSEATASATINGGEFIASGQTGFSVYNYADVTFAPGEGKSITVQGVAAGLTIEGIHNGNNSMSYAGSVINISGGTFIGTGPSNLGGGDGIWFDNKHVELIITGGNIDGYHRHGINITDTRDGSSTCKVSIKGATITNAIYHGNNVWFNKYYDIYIGADIDISNIDTSYTTNR